MKRTLGMKTSLSLSLLGLVLSGCAYAEPVSQDKTTLAPLPTSIKEQAQTLVSGGLKLSLDTLTIDVPNSKGGKAEIAATGGEIVFALEGLSVHGVRFDMNAPLAYNGVSRLCRANIPGDESFYISLTNPDGDTPLRNGVKLKASIAPKDSHVFEGGNSSIDSSTRGIYYYEYGQLDYFIASVLESFDVESFRLFNKEGGFSIDEQAIVDAFSQITEETPNYFRYKPLGEDHSLSLGLASENGVISRIDLPYQENPNNPVSYEFENGLKLRLSAQVEALAHHDYTPFYSTSSYMQLEDSLELVTTLGDYVSAKQYGFSGSFSLLHEEAAVAGTSTTFGRNAVSESATLSISGNADLTKEGDKMGFDLELSQGSKKESIGLHLARKDDSSNRKAYLSVNNGQAAENSIRLKTDITTVSSLASTLMDALGRDEIQNDTIRNLVSGLLSSIEEVQTAIDAIKGSALFASIDKNEYQDILDTIVSYSYDANSIVIKIDLSQIEMVGTATVTLTKNTLSLLSLSLDHVGINTDSDTNPFTFTLDGSLTVGGYEEPIIVDSAYQELDGLTSWKERIIGIAGEKDEDGNYVTQPTHQMSASLSGYLIKKATSNKSNHSNITMTMPGFDGNVSSSQQGLTFSGNLAFDLAKKIGTGKATITEHKEKYLNDHNLAIDVTGPENENLSDAAKKENDFYGNDANNGGFLLFSYDSKNSNATKNISGSSTTEPSSSNPLKARISISCLDDVIATLTRLLQSKEPRFKRLTNAFNDFSGKTTLGAIMNGKYLTALSAGFIESVSIDETSDTFVLKNGLLQENGVLKLRLGYESRITTSDGSRKGLPRTIEAYIDGSDSQIYVKIDITSTDWSSNAPSFNWYSENKTSSDYASSSMGFTSYSSLSSLLDYLEGTITLGGTASDDTTTYRIGGTIVLSVIGIKETYKIDLVLKMKGTGLQLFAAIETPDMTPLSIDLITENYINIYYESDGDSTATQEDEVYFVKYPHTKTGFIFTTNHYIKETARVKVSDFKENILNWLLEYVFCFGSVITNRIGSDSASSKAIHGEDLLKSVTTQGNISKPSWVVTISMNALTHMSLFSDLQATIGANTVTYSGNSAGKKTLVSLDGTTGLSVAGISVPVTVTIDLDVKNISNSTYYSAWNNSSYGVNRFGNGKNDTTLTRTSVTGQSAFSSLTKTGKYYVKPGVVKS